MSYRKLIKAIEENLALLESQFEVNVPDPSWVNEAIDITKDLIKRVDSKKSLDNSQLQDEFYMDKCFSSVSQLYELNSILYYINLLDRGGLHILLRKLKVVFMAPLLMSNENENTNEGRNTLFELRLFIRLNKNGYNAKLSSDHPDIIVIVNGREYAIECKRIFKPETLVINVNAAINQLLKYSLRRENRTGIVAISITRFFHSGDKFLEAETEEAAKARINHEMKILLESHKQELFTLFPFEIPALILDFSDRGSIKKPYTFNFLDIVETANGRLSKFGQVMTDFTNLAQ